MPQAVLRTVERNYPSSFTTVFGPADARNRQAPTLVTEAEAARSVARARARPVEQVELERIVIRDFRGIEALDLHLPAQDDRAPWTMLLGENGHGKTSVLQAIALVLMGERARARLKHTPDEFIRRQADVAEIDLHIAGALEPRQLRIERGRGRYEAIGDDTPAALAAYGAGRIPTPWQTSTLPRRYRTRPRIESLFDSHAHLMPASR